MSCHSYTNIYLYIYIYEHYDDTRIYHYERIVNCSWSQLTVNSRTTSWHTSRPTSQNVRPLNTVSVSTKVLPFCRSEKKLAIEYPDTYRYMNHHEAWNNLAYLICLQCFELIRPVASILPLWKCKAWIAWGGAASRMSETCLKQGLELFPFKVEKCHTSHHFYAFFIGRSILLEIWWRFFSSISKKIW